MFDNKSKIEILKEYPKLKSHSDIWISEIYNKIQSHQIINEFITRSIDIKKVLSQLNNRFKLKFDNAIIGSGFNLNALLIQFKYNQFNNLNSINKFMDTMGWYPAYLEKGGNYEFDNVYARSINKKEFGIFYEPKFDNQIDRTKLGNIIYHATPDILLKKIQLLGLTPKTKSKISHHPERIYFLKTLKEAEDICITLWNNIPNKTQDLIEYYYVLQIDIMKLRNDIKFYNDPNFYMGDGAIWCFQNIPPNAIKIKEKIFVNPKI